MWSQCCKNFEIFIIFFKWKTSISSEYIDIAITFKYTIEKKSFGFYSDTHLITQAMFPKIFNLPPPNDVM